MPMPRDPERPWLSMDDILMGLESATDPLYRLRYGVTAREKSKMAMSGQIPGGKPPGQPEDYDREERRAAGYLFGKRWPILSEPITNLANKLRFWEDPELHQIALEATRRGKQDSGQSLGLLYDMPEQRLRR